MKFKVGDRVKSIVNISNIKRDDIGTVKRIDSGDYPYYVKWERTNNHYSVSPKEIIKLRKGKQKLTHIVLWNESSKDPHQFFTNKPDVTKFIKELSEKSHVVKDSILVVTIKTVKKVKIHKRLSLTNYKI